MNKNAQKYYKTIYHMFPEHTHEEKSYLHKLKKFIERYDQLHPEATYEYYLEEFGEPQEVVSSYYIHIDHSLIIEKMKVKRLIKIATILLVTSFLSFMLWISYIRYIEFQSQTNLYTETTIQEENP